MIRIKSKRHNFRRCGIAHPKEAVEYPDKRFTPAELAILQAEPNLVVEIVSKKQPDPPAAAAEIPEKEPVNAEESGKAPVKTGKKGKK
jgi:hypothetical protein